MSFRIPFLRFLALPTLLGAFFLIACHLGGEEKVEVTISFNQIFDSLKQYDNVVISLKDENGNTIDVVFEGKVKVPGDVEKLAAPHWDGGKITVSIVGFKDGKIVYNTETGFDGANNKKDSTYVFVDPIMGLSYAGGAIPMLEGDSINLPSITITPANLKIKDLTWTSSASDVVRIGTTGFKALKAGNAQITVALKADSTKNFTIQVTVVDPSKIPESLALSADTLKLSAGGAKGRLDLQFVPSTAAKDVVWSILDTTVAIVAADGSVKGIKAGETRLAVVSSLKASANDTAIIVVTSSKPPEMVIFAKTETEIFVGGAAESLLVVVEPSGASQDVDFTVTTPLLIEIKNGRISGLGQGDGMVIVASRVNPLLMDTLMVKVSVKQVITSVTLGKKALTVYTGGEEPVLTAAIEPTTSNQMVQWRVDQAGIATVSSAGKVTGVSQGHTRIHAISLVDSTKQDSADITVKTDAPVVNIGRPDTIVSVGSTVTFLPVVPVQEYGLVVAFRWDVDGIPGWDDTTKTVQGVTFKFEQEKEYTLRFYVRDSEGNETIATKKVSAVVGPVVTIVSPLNGAYLTSAALKIEWKVDNAVQTTGTDTVLKEGANVITRVAKDAAGKVFSASVTVYLDTVPPAKPLVRGPAAIALGKPTWTWSPGGGGNGTYRIAVDSQVFAGAGVKDTLHIPETALSEGVHTLYVQERDVAGNWSASGKSVIIVDLSGPGKPNVKVSVTTPTNVTKPKWTWNSGGGGGNGVFQYKLDNSDFNSGASTPASDTVFIPTSNLAEGIHSLYVRERDSLGNWSALGSAGVTIDTTVPGAPTVSSDAALSNNRTPTWTWSAGSGGSGNFRFRMNNPDLSTGATTTTLKSYTPATALGDATYTLYVQEADAAGNWSMSGFQQVRIDATPPSTPRIDSTPYSPVNSLKPKWTWTSGGGGNGTYRCRVDDADLSGGTQISVSSFTPPADLAEGRHTLYIQERDDAGNWSGSAARTIVVALRKIVGNRGFSRFDVGPSEMALDTAGVPYVLYGENGHQEVMTLYGNTWGLAGGQMIGSRVFDLKNLSINDDGVPYLTYEAYETDSSYSTKASGVISYRGGKWDKEGPSLGADIRINAFAFDNLGRPVVSARGGTGNFVSRLNGSAWEPVGGSQFAPGSSTPVYQSLAFNASGDAFISFYQAGNDGVYVMRCLKGATAWSHLGSENPLGLKAYRLRMRLDNVGDPVLAIDYSGRVNFARYKGGIWSSFPGPANGCAGNFSFALGKVSNPILAFDGCNSDGYQVMSLMEGNWIAMAGPKPIPNEIPAITESVISVGKSGVAMIGYQDTGAGGKTTVSKLVFEP